jgi:hypothetical protein
MFEATVIFRMTPSNNNGFYGFLNNFYRKTKKTRYDHVGRIINNRVYSIEKNGYNSMPLEEWKSLYSNQEYFVKNVELPYNSKQFLSVFNALRIFKYNKLYIYYLLILKIFFKKSKTKTRKYGTLLSSEMVAIASGLDDWYDYDVNKWMNYCKCK